MRALHTAATGMMAQELNVQVISNNIANMRTTGYKRQRAEFQDLLYEHVRRIGTQTSTQGNILPVGIDLGGGVKTVGTPRLMTQGTHLADRRRPQRRHPRRRLLQGRDAGRHLHLHPRRLVPDGRAGPHRHRRRATSCSPASPSRTTRSRSPSARQGQVSATLPGIDHADRPRPDRAHALRQQGRPAGDRRQPVRRDAGLRHAAGRRAQHRRLRRPAAGQPRAGQRRGGHRNLRPDRGAARLRDERQGHHRRRPDAVEPPPT